MRSRGGEAGGGGESQRAKGDVSEHHPALFCHLLPLVVFTPQVVREKTKQKAEEAVILLEVQGTEALRQQKQKEGGSLAMLIEEKNKAEAIRVSAEVRQLKDAG